MDAGDKFEYEISKKYKDDSTKMVAPFTNMESQLSAAPLCIQIMGSINILATKKDFSLLTEDDEKDTSWIERYQLLNEPRSFRACLEQVNSEAFEAFRLAHKNMDSIEKLTGSIPTYMKEVVKLLLGDNLQATERHLPVHLQEIRDIANECTDLATAVEHKYNLVIQLLSQLNQASLYKQGKTKEANELAIINKEIQEREQKEREEQKKQAEAEYKKAEAKLEKNEQLLQECLEKSTSIGETFTQLALAAADTTLTTVIPTLSMAGAGSIMAGAMSNAESGFALAALGVSKGANLLGGIITSKTDYAQDNEPSLERNKMSLQDEEGLKILTEMKELLEEILEFFPEDTKVKWKELQNKNTLKRASAELKNKQTGLSNYEEGMKPKFYRKIASFLEDVDAFLNDFKSQEKKEPENAIDLHDGLTKLIAQSDKTLNSFSIALNKPLTKMQSLGTLKGMIGKSLSGGNKSELSSNRIKAMHTKLEMYRSQAEEARKNADNSRERQLQANRQLMETVNLLSKFDAEAATQKSVLEVLFEGIKQFAALKTQWSKLLTFFMNISTQVKYGMGKPLKKFIDHSTIIKQDKIAGAAITRADVDQIYAPCMEAVKIGYLVNNLSSVYVEISGTYVMPQVASLSENLALDPTDKSAIQRQKNQINKGAKEMQDEIVELIKKKTDDYKKSVNDRMVEIEKKFEELIPPIKAPEKAAIKQQVKEDVNEAKEDVNEAKEDVNEAKEIFSVDDCADGCA